MRYPVRRETILFRLLYHHIHNLLPLVGVAAATVAALGLAIGLLAGLAFVAIPRAGVTTVPAGPGATSVHAGTPAVRLAEPVTVHAVIGVPRMLPRRFRENVDRDVANHGGTVLRPFGRALLAESADYLVPSSYPPRLAALETGEMDYREWSAWAAASPAPTATDPPDVLLRLRVERRCADYCILRTVARTFLLASLAGVAGFVAAGLSMVLLERALASGRL